MKTLELENNNLKLIDQRKLPDELTYVYCDNYKDVIKAIKNMTVRGAPAIGVSAAFAMALAYINDVDGLGVFAQQLFGFGKKGDVFLGISTSGNSKNVIPATVVAHAMGIKVIGLTGADGGELAQVADVAVKAPERETYMVQELHLPIYHCWCLMLEDRFFGNTVKEGKD